MAGSSGRYEGSLFSGATQEEGYGHSYGACVFSRAQRKCGLQLHSGDRVEDSCMVTDSITPIFRGIVDLPNCKQSSWTRCRKHVDKIIGYKNVNPGSGVAAKEVTIFRKFNVKIKTRMTFYDDGAQTNNMANINVQEIHVSKEIHVSLELEIHVSSTKVGNPSSRQRNNKQLLGAYGGGAKASQSPRFPISKGPFQTE